MSPRQSVLPVQLGVIAGRMPRFSLHKGRIRKGMGSGINRLGYKVDFELGRGSGGVQESMIEVEGRPDNLFDYTLMEINTWSELGMSPSPSVRGG